MTVMNHQLVKQVVYTFLLFILAAYLCGCATDRGPKATAKLEDILVKQDQGNQEVRDLNKKFFASVSAAPKTGDYVLDQGDLLQITVFEADELKTTVRISARGFITLPLLGPIEVRNLTAREAEQKIEHLYGTKYVRGPHVSVFVQEQRGAKVTVLGAVHKPGTYDFPARQHLMDVLALAEGLTEKAGKIVQVKRTGPDTDTGEPSTFMVDMDELAKRGDPSLNLEIQRGDIVFVPDAGMVYVDGAVRKPGNYPIKDRMTIQEAIVAAGGYSTVADQESIKLVRLLHEGKREVIQVNPNNIQRGASEDTLELSDRDVIFVETSTFQNLVHSLHLSIGSGILGVGYTPPAQ